MVCDKVGCESWCVTKLCVKESVRVVGVQSCVKESVKVVGVVKVGV